MKVAVHSTHNFEKECQLKANTGRHNLVLIDTRISEASIPLAKECEGISIFTGDDAGAAVLEGLHKVVTWIVLRKA